MVDDYRTTPLWVVETGVQYTLGAKLVRGDGEASYPGWGALPEWLTISEPTRAADSTAD
ncbi:hypothetical protein D3C71_1877140 [compost metagenome]